MLHFLHWIALFALACYTWTALLSASQNRVIVFMYIINNGNRTEWSPIPSVIIRVINKIDLLITSMITDWIGRHDVLLPINQNYDKIREANKASIERWTIFWMLKNPTVYSTKCTATAPEKWRVLSNYKHDVCNCPISIGNRSVRETIRD